MQKFVTALNSISSQPWAIVVLLIGAALLVACKKFGIDTTIAGGVIGVAGNMLQSTVEKTKANSEGQLTQENMIAGENSPKQ